MLSAIGRKQARCNPGRGGHNGNCMGMGKPTKIMYAANLGPVTLEIHSLENVVCYTKDNPVSKPGAIPGGIRTGNRGHSGNCMGMGKPTKIMYGPH